MKLIKYSTLLIVCLLFANNISAQSHKLPFFKGFPGSVEGKLRYYNFHYIDIKDVDGSKLKKAVGEFSRLNYKLDTLREDNYLAKDRFIEQLKDLGAKLYFQDENSVYFSFINNNIYYWGKFYSKEYKNYVVTLIKEISIRRKLHFYSDTPFVYGELTSKTPEPPVIRPMIGAVVERAKYNKFNNMEFTYTDSEKKYRKTARGKYWEYKLQLVNKDGSVDKTVSKFEINENHFSEVIFQKGKILKEIGNMQIFSISEEGYTIWCRIHASMDGVYTLKIVQEMTEDISPPVEIK
ncbi:hypothetical protein ACFLSI_01450 [Bacteroidota bacterium]